mgnify:CR=1 FL=1
MANIKSENQSIRPSQGFPNSDKTKIGYIKINSTQGQLTFTVFEIFGGVLYNKPNVHKGNVKKNNIIHLNVKTDMFIDHAVQIKQHMRMLIRVFLGLDIDDFELVMHKFK